MRAFIPAKSGAAWFALDALAVQEITGGRAWVPIPNASPEVPGVIPWRGRAIAVLDISTVVGGGEPLRPDTPRSRIVVVEAARCTLAIPVDLVREVHELTPAQVRVPHATRVAHSSSEIDLLGSTMPVLDLESLVARVVGGG
jgi:chemotaxis signal transduction protein